jgi:peptide/nickel transport system substrate-binding protein
MQLLDEAGWVAGGDGIREKDGQRLAFGMYTNAGNVIREAYLTAIQEFWAQIGVEMTPQLEPFPALVERITQTFDFECVLIGFQWSATPDQSAMWACDSYGAGFNFVMYCNEEVDAVMEAALSELDQATRIEMYTEMQNLVLADLPMAVLDFPQQISGLSNRVHNLFPSAVNARFNTQTWWIES